MELNRGKKSTYLEGPLSPERGWFISTIQFQRVVYHTLKISLDGPLFPLFALNYSFRRRASHLIGSVICLIFRRSLFITFKSNCKSIVLRTPIMWLVFTGPPRWRRGSGLDFGSEDPGSISRLPSPRVDPLMARR